MAKEIYLNGMTADQLSKMIRESLRDELQQFRPAHPKTDTEISHTARNRPPSAHLARDAHRLGEPRQDPRTQDRRARPVPRQRCRSSLESNRSH